MPSKRRQKSQDDSSHALLSSSASTSRTLEQDIAALPDDDVEDHELDEVEDDEVNYERSYSRVTFAEVSDDETARDPTLRPRSAFPHLDAFEEDIGEQMQLAVDETTGEFVVPKSPGAKTVTEQDGEEENHIRVEKAKTRRRGRPKKSQYKTMDALLGQATVHVARCQYDEAMTLLREVVRQEPKRADAYRQIAEIYEMKDDVNRSFEFTLLACHVDRNAKAYEWDEVGDRALQLKKFSTAAACYQKAARCEPTKWLYYAKRLKVLEEIGAKAMVMRTKLNAIETINLQESEVPFEGFKLMMEEVMDFYKATKDTDRYLRAMTFHVVRCYKNGREYIPLFMELSKILCDNQLYSQLMNLILGLFDGSISCIQEDEQPAYDIRWAEAMVTIYPVPDAPRCHMFLVQDNFPTILLARLILSMIKCGSGGCIKTLFDIFVERPYEPECEKFYLEIGLACEQTGDNFQGLYYAQVLTQSSKLSHLADGWYLLGYYRERCMGPEEALEAYEQCLVYDYSHVDARISISTILEALGRPDEALDILKDYNLDNCHRLPDEKILLRQARVFVNQGKTVEYLRCLRMILIPHFYTVNVKVEQIMKQRKSMTNQVVNVNLRRAILSSLSRTILEKLVNRFGTIAERDNRPFDNLSPDELYTLSMDLIRGLARQKQYQELAAIVCYAFLHPSIPSVNMGTLQNLLFFAAVKGESFPLAFEYLRYIYSVTMTSNIPEETRNLRIRQIFVAMNYVFCHYQTVCYQRYINRCIIKTPNNMMLRAMAGNNSMTSGSYKSALIEYSTALKELPNDPGINFQIALCFTHLACRRDITNRTALARRALCFMGKYMSLRLQNGPSQEICYNIGKMFHQLGMYNLATHWYEKTLEAPSPKVFEEDERTGDGILVESPVYDLKALAAYNLSLIVKSGNPAYAKLLKRKYCVL